MANPVLSALAIGAVASTSVASVYVTTDTFGGTTGGTIAMVATQSATAPTAAQILLGQDENGDVAAAQSAIGDPAAATVALGSLSGLSAGKVYYLYAVQENEIDELSNVLSGSFVTTGSTMQMSLTEARAWVRQFARSAGDSTAYDDDDIDRAIQHVGERFCRVTMCLPRADTITLTPDDAEVDLTSLDDTFAPERLTEVWSAGIAEPLTQIGYAELHRRGVEDDESGEPTALAFLDLTTAGVHPTPDDAYVLTLRWWQAFSDWVPGVSEGTADALYLNIRKDLLRQILTDGPVSVLQRNYPEHAAGAESRWQAYLETESRLMGAGNLGERVLTRQSVR